MGVLDHIQLINMAFTAGSGLLGIGIGLGVFKTTIDKIMKDINGILDDIKEIRVRQARLRGEDSESVAPVYMPRAWCDMERQRCGMQQANTTKEMADDLVVHTASIRALNNFARWSMQEKGLSIEEINRILGS